MSQVASGRLAGAIFISCIFIYFAFRAYQYRGDSSRPIFISILLVAFLDIPPTVNSFLEALQVSIPKWANITGYTMLLFGSLLGSFAVEQFLGDKVYSMGETISSRRFMLIVPIIAVMIVLFRSGADNSSFTDGVSFEVSWYFLISYSIYYLVLFATHIIIAQTFTEDLLKHWDDVGYIIRRIIGLSGIIIIAISVLLGEVNLLFFYLGSEYSHIINWVVQDLGRGLALLCLMLSFAVPEVIFLRITQPIEHYIEIKRYNVLYDLCYTLASIVDAPVPIRDHNIWRVMIDISKLREWILSHRDSDEPLRARDEATYIRQVLLEGRTFNTPGRYKPAIFPHTYPDLLAHNLTVAKKLRRSLRELRLRPHIMNVEG